MCVLAQIVRYQPRLIIGKGQESLMPGIMGMPLVVEQAVKLRAPGGREIRDFRRSWSGKVGFMAIEPQIAPDADRHNVAELTEAVTELVMLQTCGTFRAAVQTSAYQYSAQSKFNGDVAPLIGRSNFQRAKFERIAKIMLPGVTKHPPHLF